MKRRWGIRDKVTRRQGDRVKLWVGCPAVNRRASERRRVNPAGRTGWLVVTALVVFLLWVQPAAAQDGTRPVSDDEVNEVAGELFCPVCENTPLDVCPTQACSDWRELIRLQLSEGRSEEEIRAYFVEQYGDRVLAAPPRRGFNWLVYLGPFFGILVGLVLFGRYLLNMKRPAPATPIAPVETRPAQDDYIGRLERELRERDT